MMSNAYVRNCLLKSTNAPCTRVWELHGLLSEATVSHTHAGRITCECSTGPHSLLGNISELPFMMLVVILCKLSGLSEIGSDVFLCLAFIRVSISLLSN